MDAKLAAYLRAAEEAERERRLAELLLDDAEPLVRRTIRFRLRHYVGREVGADGQSIEDLCQKTLLKLIAWLRLLGECDDGEGVRDFRQYVVRVAVNACYDYLRQQYPARTRLKDSVRDLLDRHRDFAIWRDEREEFLGGFAIWDGRPSGAATSRLLSMLDDPTALNRATGGSDARRMPLAALLAGLLREAGGPVELEALVDLVAVLQDMREAVIASIDDAEAGRLPTSETGRVEAESRVEARELLALLWEAVEELPLEQRRAYFYSFRDERGEDLFSLLLAYGVAAPQSIAECLDVTIGQLLRLRAALPLKHQIIAVLLKATRPQVSKWIFRAREKVRARLFPLLIK